jgi:hypothetical protein
MLMTVRAAAPFSGRPPGVDGAVARVGAGAVAVAGDAGADGVAGVADDEGAAAGAGSDRAGAGAVAAGSADVLPLGVALWWPIGSLGE